MGFWRSLKNFIDNQIQADRERQVIRQARHEELREIREEEREREHGRIEARRQERSRRYESRRPVIDTSFYDVKVNTDWFAPGGGSSRRKKKNNNDDPYGIF